MPNKQHIEDLLHKSYEELEALKSELTKLNELRSEIEKQSKENKLIPESFIKLKDSIKENSKKYTESISSIYENLASSVSKDLSEKLKMFTSLSSDLQKEISRIESIDLNKTFQNLHKKMIENIQKDLVSELEKFDKNSKAIQSQIKELETQVDRLSNTDLNSSLEKLHKSFIDKVKKDLVSELGKIDSKAQTLQSQIDELDKQVDRLSRIDLEEILQNLNKDMIEEIKQDLSAKFEKFDSYTHDLKAKITEFDAQIERLNEIDLEKIIDEKHSEIIDVNTDLKEMMLTTENKVNSLKKIQIFQIASSIIIVLALAYIIFKNSF